MNPPHPHIPHADMPSMLPALSVRRSRKNEMLADCVPFFPRFMTMLEIYLGFSVRAR
jgi:hypothetical protein